MVVALWYLSRIDPKVLYMKAQAMVAATIISFGISGCQLAPPVDAGTPFILDSFMTTKVEEGVRRGLKDPDSARFSGFAAAQGANGAITVCGFVNSKNSFGGYVGDSPFIGTLMATGESSRFTLDGIGQQRTELAIVLQMCSRRGVTLSR